MFKNPYKPIEKEFSMSRSHRSHRSLARPHSKQELEPFGQLRNEIDRLFEDFWGNSLIPERPFLKSQSSANLLPDIDVCETNDAFVITAELPGSLPLS